MTIFKNNTICLALFFFMFSVCVLFFTGASTLTAGEHPEESQANTPEPANTQDSANNPDSHEKQLLFETNGLPDDIFEPTPDTPEKAPALTLSGTAQIRATMDTSDDDRQENNTSLRNRIILESRYKKNARVSVLSDYLYFGDDNQTDDYDLELHEAAFMYTDNRVDLSVGRQIIRWGKTDQFSPVDSINPQDFREFMIPDYEETKMKTSR